jgi:surfactin synthase thioesterase subunit
LQDRSGSLAEGLLQEAEMLELFRPLLRADLTLVETYIPTDGEALPCPVTAFSGPADAGVNRADLEARRAKPLLAAIAGRGGQDHQERTAERPARPFPVRGR